MLQDLVPFPSDSLRRRHDAAAEMLAPRIDGDVPADSGRAHVRSLLVATDFSSEAALALKRAAAATSVYGARLWAQPNDLA